jgi:hypothetical protein
LDRSSLSLSRYECWRVILNLAAFVLALMDESEGIESMTLQNVFLVTGIIYFVVAALALVLGFRGHS